jgi:hypothetical protein
VLSSAVYLIECGGQRRTWMQIPRSVSADFTDEQLETLVDMVRDTPASSAHIHPAKIAPLQHRVQLETKQLP